MIIAENYEVPENLDLAIYKVDSYRSTIMNKTSGSKPFKSDDVPAIKLHLELVRQELKSDITSLSLRFDSKFDNMESKFQKMTSVLYEMKALLEEQN